MEETQAAGGPGRLLVLTGKRFRLESTRWFIRNPGLWFHHLYSQIRRHSPGRDGGASSFANVADVPGADVLFRSRHHRWRNNWNWICAPALAVIIFLLFINITGCDAKRASLESQYAE